MERQVGHGTAARRLWQKIGKRHAPSLAASVAGKLAPSLFNEREGDVCCVMVVEGIHGTRRAAELIGAPLGTAGLFAPAASAHRRIRV